MRASCGAEIALRLSMLAIATLVVTLPAHADTPTIRWEVADRFRLFDRADEASRLRVESLLQDLARERDATSRQTYDRVLETLKRDAASLRASNIASGTTPKQSNRYSQDYLYPAFYTIRVSVNDPAAGAKCQWRVDQRPIVLDQCKDALLQIPADPSGAGAAAELYLSIDESPETLVERVRIEDELIVAMGDSYISGEGNPDVPAEFMPRDRKGEIKRYARAFQKRSWAGHIRRDAPERPGDVIPAVWWDQQCHRSLLSWPILAGLMRAARSPQRAITVAHFGCSGDEVSDGLLVHRKKLPGGGSETESQFQMLAALRAREGAPARKVDRVFLSIGGNDIGFAPVLAGLILPNSGWGLTFGRKLILDQGGAACAYRNVGDPTARVCGDEGPAPPHGADDRRSAETRLKELPDRLKALASAFVAIGVAPDQVFQAAYPNALVGTDGTMCRTALGENDLVERGKAKPGTRWHATLAEEIEFAKNRDPRAGFEGMIGKIPKFVRGWRQWNFQIEYYADPGFVAAIDPQDGPKIKCNRTPLRDSSEACQGYWVWMRLNDTIEKAARENGWTLLTDHQNAIRGKGWCNTNREYGLALPLIEANERWSNGKGPGGWNPYDFDLPRWFRTTNDSILTEYTTKEDFHRGTMHPTYHAHLHIAAAAAAEVERAPVPPVAASPHLR